MPQTAPTGRAVQEDVLVPCWQVWQELLGFAVPGETYPTPAMKHPAAQPPLLHTSPEGQLWSPSEQPASCPLPDPDPLLDVEPLPDPDPLLDPEPDPLLPDPLDPVAGQPEHGSYPWPVSEQTWTPEPPPEQAQPICSPGAQTVAEVSECPASLEVALVP